MKKIYLILSIFAILFASCNDKESALVKPTIVKIADMLYEATYDNYSKEPIGTYAEFCGDLACSSVRNGNYHGRNFDYFMNQSSIFLVRTTAKGGRYATIGVARLNNVNDAKIDAGLTDRQLEILPWAMIDGMNEKGLVVNSNVVAKKDGGKDHTDTNSGAPELNIFHATRALLDNCANVREALGYLESHNITPFASKKMNLHFMISDTAETYVVEIIDNKIVAKPQNIMTNYYVNMDTIPSNAMGVERYRILEQNYDLGGKSMEGMWELMQLVRYSNSYYAKNKWYTEVAANNSISYADIPQNTTILDKIIEDEETEWIKELDYVNQHGLREKTIWWNTTINSIYDIKNKSLWVTIHEKYDEVHKFSLFQ